MLASFSTEAQPTPQAAHRLAAAEAEAELAASGAVYMVVELERRRLAIRCRGLELEELALDEVQLLAVAPVPVTLPRRFTVQRGPFPRRLTFVTPGASPPPPRAAADAASERFTAELDGGWLLEVAAGDAGGWWSRLLQGLSDAWSAAAGEPVARPPVLVLVLRDAERLHALIRPDDPLLVVASSPWPAAWGELPPTAPDDSGLAADARSR